MKVEEVAQEVQELRQQVAALVERLDALSGNQEAKPSKPHVLAPPDEILTPLAEKSQAVLGRKGVVIHAGLMLDENNGPRASWSSTATLDELLSCPLARVARLLSPFASEQRVAILRALFPAAKGIKELEQATGLTTGQLYHHMKELLLLQYITQPERNVYALTLRGTTTLTTLLALACQPAAIPPEDVEAMLPDASTEA